MSAAATMVPSFSVTIAGIRKESLLVGSQPGGVKVTLLVKGSLTAVDKLSARTVMMGTALTNKATAATADMILCFIRCICSHPPSLSFGPSKCLHYSSTIIRMLNCLCGHIDDKFAELIFVVHVFA